MTVNAEFQVHKLNDEGMRKAIAIADAFDDLMEDLKALMPEGRALSIVKTKLEEACFFAKKGMAVDPVNQVIGDE